jgi:hypothetical protein
MLRRIPLSFSQITIFKMLGKGDEVRVSKDKSTQPNLKSILGALGRRINNTKEIHEAGLPGDSGAIFNYTKVADGWVITLTDNATSALKAEGIIK